MADTSSDAKGGVVEQPFEYGIDSNVQDIMMLYGRKPPNLSYLSYGEKTTHGQSFTYSEEVLKSLGQTGPAVEKGCFNKGSAKDGGPPWANSVAPGMEEPILSLNRQDFTVKKKLQPREEKPIDARSIMRNREHEVREKRNAEAAERDKARQEKWKKQMEAEAAVVKRNVGDTIQVFDHRGVCRRPAVLQKTADDAKVEELIRVDEMRKRNRACPPPSLLPVEESIFDPLKNPLLGGEAGTSLPSMNAEKIAEETLRARHKCLSAPKGGFEKNEQDLLIERADTAIKNNRSGAMSVLDVVRNAEQLAHRSSSSSNSQSRASTSLASYGGTQQQPPLSEQQQHAAAMQKMSMKGKTFWYPKDRQRLKYHLLEEMRTREGKIDLLKNGWATGTNPAGNDKKVGRPDLHTSLDPQEQAKVNGEVDAYIAARDERKWKLKEKEQAVIRKAVEMQQQENVARTRTGGAKQVTPAPYATDADNEDDARVTGTILRSNKRVTGQEATSPTFRPELPGNVPPKDALASIRGAAAEVDPEDMVVPAMPTNIMGVKAQALAPPWGRQTELDDKWSKVRVYDARAKKLRYEPIAKLEIDRELRICRDKGLMKKERKSLLTKLDAKQIQYIKNAPAVNTTMAHAAQPMRQAKQPAKSTL